MAEIRKEVAVLEYDANGDPIFIITPENTLADVVSWLLEQSGDDKLGLIQLVLEG